MRSAPFIMRPEDELITTGEAVRILGPAAHLVQVQRMCDRGELWHTRTPGGHRRVRKVDVEALRDGMVAGRP